MSTTLGSTGVTFPDNTTQTTAMIGNGNITSRGMWENANSITVDYNIGTNNNAVSAGPITIASGITVTVPSGSTWTIV